MGAFNKADQLANGLFDSFDPAKRIPVTAQSLSWCILPDALEAGREAERAYQEVKTSGGLPGRCKKHRKRKVDTTQDHRPMVASGGKTLSFVAFTLFTSVIDCAPVGLSSSSHPCPSLCCACHALHLFGLPGRTRYEVLFGVLGTLLGFLFTCVLVAVRVVQIWDLLVVLRAES